MTLSLEDVRNKRFRLARKSGYEVAEVDDFLDQVQESFAQLVEENETLKNQVGSLGGDAEAVQSAASAPGGMAADAGPREPAEPETVVVTTSAEASGAVVRLVQLSTEHAEQLVAEANVEAERIRSEAGSAAEKLGSDSEAEAERLRAEAREHAEGLRSDAQSRAEQLDADTEQRRNQMLGDLDAQRTSLTAAIDDLRHFEQSFRANLSDHLHRHLDVLSSGGAEPTDVPELAAAGRPSESAPADSAPEDSASQDSGPQDSGPQDSGPADFAPGETEPAVEDTSVESSDDEVDDREIETDPDATIQVTDTPRLNALLGGDQQH